VVNQWVDLESSLEGLLERIEGLVAWKRARQAQANDLA
jgi:hypothetical protein